MTTANERGPLLPTPPRLPSGVLAYFVRHRTAANLLLLLLVVAGAVAATKIRAQYFPDVAVETVRIKMKWPGVGPREVDEAIIQKIEPKLRVIDGVQHSFTRAREGQARFWIEFQPSWNMDRALDDVRAVLDDIRDLPQGVDPPVFRRTRWFDRVVNVIITGNVGVDLLDRYSTELKNKLLANKVISTEIRGASDPEVRIEVRPEMLERYKLSLASIAAAIKAETGTKPVGEIDRGIARIRTQAKDVTAQALADVPVRSLPDGTKLRLKDVATLIDWGLDRKSAAFYKGKPAILMRINRDAKGDALKLQRTVEKITAEMRPTLPQGVELVLTGSRAKDISSRLWLLVKNGLGGLMIVLALLFVFLSSRTAFWVAVGIPVAMSATIAMMYLFGFTLNMISLFALLICLGIIVDDAIVVGEHADHLAQQGYPPADAATLAAQKMAAPVFAASITTVIAFSVLILIEGRFGKMLADFPFTVGVVIVASLLESFLILPAHMRHSLAAARGPTWADAPSIYVNRNFRRIRDDYFKPALRIVLGLRYPVAGFIVLLLLLSITAIVDRTISWRFFSSPERPIIRANFAMFESAKRADTKAMLDELDRALDVVNRRFKAKYGRAPVKVALAQMGGTSGRRSLRAAEAKIPDLIGSYQIELIDADLRPYQVKKFSKAWKKEISMSPLVEVSTLRRDRSGPGGDDIEVYLLGDDEGALKQAAETMKLSLRAYPAVTSVEDDLPYDKPELLLTLTPKGEALGFTTETISRLLRERLYGIEAIKLAKGSREITVRVKLPDDAVGPNFLRQAKLPLAGGGFVPLAEIATVRQTYGFSAIRRENGRRHATVSGDIIDNPVAHAEVIRALRQVILPDVKAKHGVEYQLTGLTEDEQNFVGEAKLGFGLAMAGIYLVLAWIFGSWTRPILIMLIIPFGIIGAAWGHWLHGVSLSMMSVVGLIGMAGIIINDSIVLVTTIDERLPHQDTITAVVEGTSERLRAVLLTTLTTVGGLTPMLFEASRQALFLKPTVITLAYGLGFGMILVLILTPALIVMEHDIKMRLASFRRLAGVRARHRRRLASQNH